MIYKFVNFPVVIEVGAGLLDEFTNIIHMNNLHFERPAIITGKTSWKFVKRYNFTSLGKHYYIQDSTPEEISMLRKAIINQKHDAIIACGGGRVIDIGKYLSRETLVPIISVPTLLSNDAISSPISILRINGEYKSIGTVMPTAVIVDIDIIKRSPKKYILAGLGDLISNISASFDWILAHKEIGEKMDNFARIISYLPARTILESFESYSCINNMEFLETLAYGLILSGIAMNVAHSSRPASGSEHNISHALDRIIGFGKVQHGIQVGLATILTTYLQGQKREHQRIIEMYNKFGLPTHPGELRITWEEFERALELAPRIRDRFTILNKYSPKELIGIAHSIFN